MNRMLAWIIPVMAVTMLNGMAVANSITNLQLFDGTSNAPIATITYSNPNSATPLSANVYADPVVSSHTTTPIYYCIDLWHDNTIGSTYTITATSKISFSQTSTFTDVDNRLAWLVHQPQNTADERGAVQLALWYTLDNKVFSVSSSDKTLISDYNNLIKFTGYDQNIAYSAQLWNATHTGKNLTENQDLISATPEPSSLLLAGLSLGGVVLYLGQGRRRFV